MLPGVVVVFWLIVLCLHDLRAHVLPNRLTVPAMTAVTVMGCTDHRVALSIIVLGAPYLVAAVVGACGGGDLKLAVALGGLIADPMRAAVVVVIAAIATLAAVAIGGAAVGRGAAIGDAAGVGTRRGAGVAHGPALAAAVVSVGGVWV